MEEVIYADQVYVMDEGKVVMQGTPREIFSQVERVEAFASGCTAGYIARL